jgi:hypothetical protein
MARLPAKKMGRRLTLMALIETNLRHQRLRFTGTRGIAFVRQHTLWVDFVIIIASGLMLTFPTIIYGFPADGHDSMAHLTWYTQFSEQLLSGQLYPRWLLNENAGLGSPTFFYYGAVPYFLTTIFLPLSQFDPYGWYQIGLSAMLAVVLSGATCYFWIRSRTNSLTALFAALLYMLMPYHLAIDFYERAAFAELWTFAWMPLILYFVSATGQKKPSLNGVGLGISYSLLIMTHLPTTLIFSPIPVVYAFLVSHPERKFKALLLTSASMLLGIVLSAIYLLPALGTQDYVFVGREAIKTLYLSNFLFQGFIPETTFDLKLTLVVLSMAIMGFAGIILGLSISNPVVRREHLFWIFVSATAIFMMTPLSEPLIRAVPPLHRIQFPWRYNAVLVVSITAIMALGISDLRKPYPRKVIGSMALSILLIIGWLSLDIRQALIKSAPPHYVRGMTSMDKIPLNEIIGRGTFDINYRPRTVQTDLRLWAEETPKISGVTVGDEVSIEKWESRRIIIAVNSPTDFPLTLGQLYYPGWTAQIIGQHCCLPLRPSDPDGLITGTLPAGSYELGFELSKGPFEQAGQIITLLGMAIVLVVVVWCGVAPLKRGRR